MTNVLSYTLDTLAFGQSQVVGNRILRAILGARGAAAFLTLEKSIEQGVFEITETSEKGSGSETQFVKGAERDVHLLDSNAFASE